MNRRIVVTVAALFSLLSLTSGCAADPIYAEDSNQADEPPAVTYFHTVHSDEDVAAFTQFLHNLKDPKRLQLQCEQQQIATSCYHYAAYTDLITEDYAAAYDYYQRAFALGIKQMGYAIAELQINYPERFPEGRRLSIDEIISYLKHAANAGSPDATRLLMLIYRDPQFERVDYAQAEFYNTRAIEQDVTYARYTLAFLYTHHLKDKSRIDESIALYKDDLIIEGNWESSYALVTLYINPDKFGAKRDYVKALAYAYVTRDLRNNLVSEATDDEILSDVYEAIDLLPRSLTPEQRQQAKALYLETMAQLSRQPTVDVEG